MKEKTMERRRHDLHSSTKFIEPRPNLWGLHVSESPQPSSDQSRTLIKTRNLSTRSRVQVSPRKSPCRHL